MRTLSDSLKITFLTVFFSFLLFYVFARLFGPLPFHITSVNTNKADLFTVSGTGEATAVPQTAKLSFSVVQQAASVEDAKEKVNKASNAINDKLKSLGIPEKNIKTVNYSVNPDYDYSSNARDIKGYTVVQTVAVEITPVEKANQAIDEATKLGANDVSGVQFVLDDDKKDELEQQAREIAIKKAKEKANRIANAAGIRLGKIVNVMEDNNQYPYMYDAKMEAAGGVIASAPTQLQAGENTVKMTVTLYYETL